MIKKLNENVDIQKLEQRIDDVINDVKDLYESSGRLNDAFVQNKSDGSYAYEKVILKLLECTSMLSPIWYRIHYCLKKTFPDYRMPKIAESKLRNRKRSIKEDIDDYEIIASFKSSNFCVGDFEDVEQDLLDLVLSNEQALKELISFLRDVGYSVEGDFDAEDYVDWFGSELYECIAVDQESELSFGHFKFKQKNLHNYY